MILRLVSAPGPAQIAANEILGTTVYHIVPRAKVLCCAVCHNPYEGTIIVRFSMGSLDANAFVDGSSSLHACVAGSNIRLLYFFAFSTSQQLCIRGLLLLTKPTVAPLFALGSETFTMFN